jgi:predicted nucleic acid-binding protein
MIAIDSNILILAHRTCKQHEEAKQVLQDAADRQDGWGFSLPSIVEFWKNVTHASYPEPSSTKEAGDFLNLLIEDLDATVFMPIRRFDDFLIHYAQELNVSGNRIFDLQIGLMAQLNGVSEMWTCDRKFIHIPKLKIIHPF